MLSLIPGFISAKDSNKDQNPYSGSQTFQYRSYDFVCNLISRHSCCTSKVVSGAMISCLKAFKIYCMFCIQRENGRI